MGIKIDKKELELSVVLGYSVWLIKSRGGYEIKKVSNGEFLMNGIGEPLWFKNLSQVKEYIEELEERNEWEKAGLPNA